MRQTISDPPPAHTAPFSTRRGRPAFRIAGLALLVALAVCLAAPSFALAASGPTVTRVSPATGLTSGGNTVTVYGKNFKVGGRNVVRSVTFSGTRATGVRVRSATRLTVTAPAHARGMTNVRITTSYGMSGTSSRTRYAYLTPEPITPAPVVRSISPTAGPSTGGTVVTITGTAFSGVTGVMFGTTPAFFLPSTSTSLLAMAPAGSGTADVRVITLAGTSPVSAGATFAYQTAPTVGSVTPDNGPASGGTAVTISGSSFTGATAVRFGSASAASFTVTSPTSINAVTPAGTGTVPVTVVTPQGTSTSSVTFKYAAPVITAVTATVPHPVTGGNDVTITGTGFAGVTSVTFGTNSAAITSWTDTVIHATAPAGTGTVPVTVTSPLGKSAASAAAQYTYAPTITRVDPIGGSPLGGTTVTITGSGFTGATAVRFGSAGAVSFTVSSDTQMSAVAPAFTGVTVVDITVTTAAGQSATTTADSYSYGPAISSVSPASGPAAGGTLVTVRGVGFSGATSVMFGAESAILVSLSDTQLSVLSPAHESGTVDVRITTTAGTSPLAEAARFTYAAAPTVTGLDPDHGPAVGGTTVTITGTDFIGATAVKFGTSAATSVTVISATTLRAVSPAGAGTVPVTVVTPLGTSAVVPAAEFSYAAPDISGLSPDHGPAAGGTSVTIAGSGFTGATAVKFGTSAAQSFTVSSDTTVTAMAPAGTGTVTVSVTTAQGTSANVSQAHFVYAPTISSLTPDHGPAAGGNDVTITGTGFADATGVTFNGVPGTGFHVSSDTSVIVTAPGSAVGGAVDVVIHTADQASEAATYTYAPIVSGISPTHGPAAGGNDVAISGTGFDGVSDVLFGTTPGVITSWTPTLIHVSAPAGTGVVHLTVETAGGTSEPTDYTYDAP